MPRRARLAVAGVPWHIIQRGNNRSSCFYSREDYQYYLQTLSEQANKYGCAIHAYVLMTNHVHLLLTPEEATSPSLMMKHLGQRYVQYINRTYRRSGTLWEGRFKSCLAQQDNYVLVCCRYIELNPVRAGMVNRPDKYAWSSFHSNGLGVPNSLITPHKMYMDLGDNKGKRLVNYRRLFEAQLNQETVDKVRHATNGNYALGNDRFQQEIENILGRRVKPGSSGRPLSGEKTN